MLVKSLSLLLALQQYINMQGIWCSYLGITHRRDAIQGKLIMSLVKYKCCEFRISDMLIKVWSVEGEGRGGGGGRGTSQAKR